MAEKIYTTSSTKQHFQYLFARHLSHLGLPFNYSFLQQIDVMLISQEEIRKQVLEKLDSLQKDGFIKDKMLVLSSLGEFKQLYFQTSFLLEALKKKVDDKGMESDQEKSFRTEINKVLQQINTNLPVINNNLMLLFALAIECTDLVHVVAPREEILFPDKIFNKDQAKENREMKYQSQPQ